MVQGSGFKGSGFSRTQSQQIVRIAVVVAFFCISAFVVGVPLIMKPAVVVPVAPAVPTPLPVVDVWMPTQRIPQGTLLTPLLFRKETLSESALAALGGRPVRHELELAGRYARMLIVPGRPVTVDQLMDAPDSALTRKIRPGFRAVTIELTHVSGIEGWGTPGAKVDVMWVSNAPDDGRFVTTIVKGVQILSVAGKAELSPPPAVASTAGTGGPASATGRSTGAPAESPNQEKIFTVTLLVTPEEGQKIFLASRSGELSLMLQGDVDAPQDRWNNLAVTTRKLAEGVLDPNRAAKKLEGVARSPRDDGKFDQWSVIEGRVWRVDRNEKRDDWARDMAWSPGPDVRE